MAYHVISHTDTEGIQRIVQEIKRVLRHEGEFFVTLCSKQSPSFLQCNRPKLDKNTIVKTEDPECGLPHFHTDLSGLRELFSEFVLLRMRHVEDIFDDGKNWSWHYFIHGKA